MHRSGAVEGAGFWRVADRGEALRCYDRGRIIVFHRNNAWRLRHFHQRVSRLPVQRRQWAIWVAQGKNTSAGQGHQLI